MTTELHVDPQAIVHRAARTDLQTIAARLQEVLGRRLTAYIANVRDPKAVTRWATGYTAQIRDPDVERRLREAYVVCEVLTAVGEAPETIRAWALGMEPLLDDEAPLDVLRSGDLRAVRNAAFAFAGGA